jgi:hypothetical protein
VRLAIAATLYTKRNVAACLQRRFQPDHHLGLSAVDGKQGFILKHRDAKFTEHAARKLSVLCASVFVRLLPCIRSTPLTYRPCY